jgi:uncharacterized caspase-like protein
MGNWQLVSLLTCAALVWPAAVVGQDKPLELRQRQQAAAAGNYAVVIGIDKYADADVGPLAFAEADARAFAEVLRSTCGYPADHVYELLGPQASLAAIMQRAYALGEAGMYPRADTVILYFSGHGAALGGENYLIPYDGTADEALAKKKNISLPEVVAPLKKNFKTQVVFLDACRNAADAGAKALGEGGFIDPRFAAQESAGLCVMFGTELGKYSREDAALGHGLFTAALLAGLGGGAAASLVEHVLATYFAMPECPDHGTCLVASGIELSAMGAKLGFREMSA